jgi:hypothetical protein
MISTEDLKEFVRISKLLIEKKGKGQWPFLPTITKELAKAITEVEKVIEYRQKYL